MRVKDFEEICKRNQKPQLLVELDLRYALKSGSRKKKWDKDYYRDLRSILEGLGCIEFVPYKMIITERGKEILKRGWVIKRVILLVLPSIKELLFRSI